MEKELLKSKLNELKTKIKTNSKDAHFAETLLDELLSIKGQIDVEPTLVHVPLADVDRELDGETFKMAVLKNGDAVYHVRGGYTLIADGSRMFALAQTIKDYVDSKDLLGELSDEEREMYELDMSASTYILNLPMYAFTDQEFKYDIATMCIKWLRESYDKALEEPLQEEDKELDDSFEDAAIALEDIKDGLKKTKKS